MALLLTSSFVFLLSHCEHSFGLDGGAFDDVISDSVHTNQPKVYQKQHQRPTVDSHSVWADIISVVFRLHTVRWMKKKQKRIRKFKN